MPPPEVKPVPPPAPTEPANQLATPPSQFTVTHEFERVLQAQASGFHVKATPRMPQLRVGKDRLSFDITSERDGFVYVLVNGPDGSLILLMPNNIVTNNKIRAGQSDSMPPATWKLDTVEPTGREDFLVIVSQSKRDFKHLATGRQDGLLVLPTGEGGAALAREFSGPGSVLSGRATCEASGCDEYGAAKFSVDIVR